jgi:glycosyltransferase involved in cell wall biosynthesis
MARAKPILASDLEQIGEVLRPAIHVDDLPAAPPGSSERAISLLSPPGDVARLARGIQFLVENAGWRSTLGRNACDAVAGKYTWKRHVEEILGGLSGLNRGVHS